MRWVECLRLIFPKWVVTMQQVGVILMEEHYHEQCAHTFQKNKSKPLVKLSTTKQSFKSSYTIPKGLPNERCGKHGNIEINVFLFKTKFIFGWKLSTKGKKSTSANGRRCQRAVMVSINGVVGVLWANVRIDRTYSPTWANARVWHNCANGGGIGSGAIVKDLWEANACVLIVYSSCNVSQSSAMYRHKWVHIS